MRKKSNVKRKKTNQVIFSSYLYINLLYRVLLRLHFDSMKIRITTQRCIFKEISNSPLLSTHIHRLCIKAWMEQIILHRFILRLTELYLLKVNNHKTFWWCLTKAITSCHINTNIVLLMPMIYGHFSLSFDNMNISKNLWSLLEFLQVTWIIQSVFWFGVTHLKCHLIRKS